MLAVVFAMITLQNADPDPVATPAASIAGRLTGQASGTGFQGLGDSSGFGNLTVTAGCTYGAPRLGPNLFGDASDLTRTFSAPQCDPSALSPFASGLAVPAAFGFVPVFVPLGGATSFHAPVSLDGNFATSVAPSRSFAIRHLALPTEMTGGLGTTGLTVRASVPGAAAARGVVAPHKVSTRN